MDIDVTVLFGRRPTSFEPFCERLGICDNHVERMMTLPFQAILSSGSTSVWEISGLPRPELRPELEALTRICQNTLTTKGICL